jgi:hypothetical protein
MRIGDPGIVRSETLMIHGVVQANEVWEWSLVSDRDGAFREDSCDVDVQCTGPDGRRMTIPAFWARDKVWRVRFAAPIAGEYTLETQCSETQDKGLGGQGARVMVTPYGGDNRLLSRGPIVARKGERIFRHSDGTPFFWLADTWWMGLCDRLKWPGEFQRFALDRMEQGFSVIQIVAGLYPDMPPLHESGKNEAGTPWDEQFASINPSYFDAADRRIKYLCDIGIVPCIFGCWGYFSQFMGVEKLKRHWRYLIARWGAYPVIWSLAGEAILPYYLHPSFGKWAEYTPKARAEWTEIARYVRSLQPFGRPISIHPPNYMEEKQGGHDQIEDRSLLDYDMLQTAHGTQNYFWHSVAAVRHSCGLKPSMPVLMSEGFYEGILESSREETQRWFFWSSILSGAAGHTYGANGIWQLNQPGKPFRANPMGMHWGDIPWNEAAKLPGAKQIALGKKLLEELPWWEMEPRQDWLQLGKPSPVVRPEHAPMMTPYCAGIPRKLRLIYWPNSDAFVPLGGIAKIEPGVRYQATLVNPSTGEKTAIGPVVADKDGNWPAPKPPVHRDWLLVLQSE